MLTNTNLQLHSYAISLTLHSTKSSFFHPAIYQHIICTSMFTIHPSESASPVLHSKFIKIYFQPLDTQEAQLLKPVFSKSFFIVVQVQLSPFSLHQSPLPHPPHLPHSVLPLFGFAFSIHLCTVCSDHVRPHSMLFCIS